MTLQKQVKRTAKYKDMENIQPYLYSDVTVIYPGPLPIMYQRVVEQKYAKQSESVRLAHFKSETWLIVLYYCQFAFYDSKNNKF